MGDHTLTEITPAEIHNESPDQKKKKKDEDNGVVWCSLKRIPYMYKTCLLKFRRENISLSLSVAT